MPEIPDVAALEEIVIEWGNAIRDRTVQRYNDPATRASESPTPTAGDLSFLEDTGDLSVFFGGSWRKLVPSGVVLPYAGSAAPAGYLICNGAEISRSTYADLFTAIGTAFGAGDGSTTFNIPDLRQRFPLGVAASGTGSTRGATGGLIDHVHAGGSHVHAMTVHTHGMLGHTHSVPNHVHDLGNSATDGGGAATGSGGSHSHTFSDTSTGPSANSTNGDISGAASVPTSSHTHSVSGTTSSAGSHTHSTPNHDHDLGNSASSGSTTTGGNSEQTGDASSSLGDTGAGGTANTGTANPPFVALHYIIRI